MTDELAGHALAAVAQRMLEMQSRFDPAWFGFHRNGLRLGVASLEDELQELWAEWHHHKRHLGNGIQGIRHELLDIAGVALLIYVESLKDDQRADAATIILRQDGRPQDTPPQR